MNAFFYKKLIRKVYIFPLCLFFIGCYFDDNTNSTINGPTNKDAVNLSAVSAQYADGLSGSSANPLSSITFDFDCETKGGSKGSGENGVTYIFDNTGIFSTIAKPTNSSSNNANPVYVTPNDNTCKFYLISMTVNDIIYTFGNNNNKYPVKILGNNNNTKASYLPQAIQSNLVKTPTGTSSIYVNAKLDLSWTGTGKFTPSLNIVYGTNAASVSSVISSNYQSVLLNAKSVNGQTINAPTYCIGGQSQDLATPGLACDPIGSKGPNLVLGYDAMYYIESEVLNIIVNPQTTPGKDQQLAESFKFFALPSSEALVKNGVLTSALNSSSVSAPSSSNCGLVDSASGGTHFADISGCTYDIVDALFNSNIKPISSGVVNSETTITSKIFDATANAENASPLTATVSNSTISAITGSWLAFDKKDPTKTYGIEIFGYKPGVKIPGIYSNTDDNQNNLHAQNAVRYLIIQHKDGGNTNIAASANDIIACTGSDNATCIPSYQLFVINTGASS